jgi:pectinesterase
VTNCTFYEMKPGSAAMWHDGSKERDMKFVLRDCRFDGTNGWVLARHHLDAQLYFLDCTFAQSMADRPVKRVIYPLNGGTPSEADIEKNAENDRRNLWGERNYFWNCRREGGDFAWHSNNLATAPNSPAPGQITAAWTFANTWNPERADPPAVKEIIPGAGQLVVVFSEAVTVKGRLQLKLRDGQQADYVSGSGSKMLVFKLPAEVKAEPVSLVLNGGAIVASEAGSALRLADAALPAAR